MPLEGVDEDAVGINSTVRLEASLWGACISCIFGVMEAGMISDAGDSAMASAVYGQSVWTGHTRLKRYLTQLDMTQNNSKLFYTK